MFGRKTGTEHKAAMLHHSARQNEQRSNGPDIGFRDPTQHLLKPMIIESFDVVIEEAEDLAIAASARTIVQSRKIEFPGIRNTVATRLSSLAR